MPVLPLWSSKPEKMYAQLSAGKYLHSLLFLISFWCTSSLNANTCVECPGFGASTVVVTNTNDSGDGSLREAITCANSNTALDRIHFDLPGNGPHYIVVESELPPIMDQGIVIDGTTQPGWTIGDVVINGSILTGSETVGLELDANEVEVYGLQIESFSRAAISFGSAGIRSFIRIGAQGKENVLGCFEGQGSVIELGNALGQAGSENVIEFNYIGVTANGDPLGGRDGVFVQRTGAMISHNVIAHLSRSAIYHEGQTTSLASQNSAYCISEVAYRGNTLMNLFSPVPSLGFASLDQIAGSSQVSSGSLATIEVYISGTVCEDCENGIPQGATLLGITGTSEIGGTWILEAEDYLVPVQEGDFITAVGIREEASSSFAACMQVTAGACSTDEEPPVIDSLDLDGNGRFSYAFIPMPLFEVDTVTTEVVAANQPDCSATLTIPEITATDNCSETFTFSGIIALGPDFTATIGPFAPGETTPPLPPGEHLLTVTATDEAGNDGFLETSITVRDATPPVATISLPDTVIIEANDLDCLGELIFDLSIADNCENSDLSFLANLSVVPNNVPTGVNPPVPNPISVLDTTLTFSELFIGEYDLFVTAFDAANNSSSSAYAFVRVVHNGVDEPVCLPNETITLTNGGDQCGGLATLTAAELLGANPTDCAGPVNYSIYREVGSEEIGFMPVVGNTSLNLNCNDVGILPVRVYALDAANAFNFCTVNVMVTPADGCLPDAARPELICDTVTTSSVTISWETDPGVEEYTYQINGGSLEPAVTNTLTVDDLEAGQEVQVIVNAIPLNGCGTTSDTIVCTATFPQTVDYTISFPADFSVACGNFVPEDIVVGMEQNLTCGSVLSSEVTNVDTLDGGADACFVLAITVDVTNSCEYAGEAPPVLVARDADQDDIEGNSLAVVHVLAGEDAELLNDDLAFLDSDGDRTDLGTAIDGYAVNASRGFFRYVVMVSVDATASPTIAATVSEGNFTADAATCDAQVVFSYTANSLCFGDLAGQTVVAYDFNANDPNEDFMINSDEFVEDVLAAAGVTETITILAEGGATVTLENVPVGYHGLRLVTTPLCGPAITEYFTFEVVDADISTPVCQSNLMVSLSGEVDDCAALSGTITPGEVLASFGQDCSPPIGFALYTETEAFGTTVVPEIGRSLTFNCADVGDNLLRLYALDGSGNTSFCQASIRVNPAAGQSCTGGLSLNAVVPPGQCIVYAGFDLTVVEPLLTAGLPVTTVSWFFDEAGQTPIANPLDFAPAAAPVTVYARGVAGTCLTPTQAVTFTGVEAEVLTFSGLPVGLCSAATPFFLPTPDEGVPGIWRLESEGPVTTVNPAGRAGDTLRLIFDASPDLCVEPFVYDLPVADVPQAVIVDPGETVCQDSIITIAYGGANAGALEFFWSGGTNDGPAPGNGPAADFLWTTAGPATVSLTVERYGCSTQTEVTFDVTVCDPCETILDCLPRNGQVGSVLVLDTEAFTNTSLCLPVVTDNFTNVVGFSFTVDWDTEQLTYAAIQNINPAVVGLLEVSAPVAEGVPGINTSAAGQGYLTTFYRGYAAEDDCTSASSFSLEQGVPLFEICFTANAPAQNSLANIGFAESPQPEQLLTTDNCTAPGIGSLATFGGSMSLLVDCSDEDNIVFLIGESSDPGCGDENSGEINLDVTGAAPPFTFLWSNGDTTKNIFGLGEGMYDVTVTDANDCSESLSESELFTFNFVYLEPTISCPDELEFILPQGTDTISVLVAEPDAGDCSAFDVTYEITGASQASGVGPIGVFSFNLGVSTIAYSIGDSICSHQVIVREVEEACSVFGVTVESIQSPTCTESDGEILIQVNGQSPGGPIDFSWTLNGEETEITELAPTGLSAGLYGLSYTDITTGCGFSVNFNLEPNTPVVLNADVTDATSEEAEDGMITVNYTGASLPASLVFFLEGDPVFSLPVFSEGPISYPALPGNYAVVITDANGCEATRSVIVGVISCEEPITGTTLETTICPGEIFPWGENMYDSSGVFLDTLTTASGCDSILTLALNVEASAEVDITGDLITCGGIEAVLNASGAESYNWVGVEQTYTGANVVIPPGSYELNVVTTSGCAFFAQEVTIETVAAPTINLLTPNASVCAGGTTMVAVDLSDNETVSWFSSPDNLPLGNGPELVVNSPSLVTVVVSDTVTGCLADQPLTIAANNDPPFFTSCPADVEVRLNLAEATSVDVTLTPAEAYSGCGDLLDISEAGIFTNLTRDTAAIYVATSNGQSITCTTNINVVETSPTLFYVASDQVRLTGEDTLWVPIGVVNFEQIAGFQLPFTVQNMDAEGTVLNLVNTLSPLLSESINTEQLDSQALNLIWLRNNPSSISIPDSTLLLEVAVLLTGEPGGCVRFDFAGALPETALAFGDEGDLYPGTLGGDVCLPALADVGGRILRLTSGGTLTGTPNVEVNLLSSLAPRQQTTPGNGNYFFPELMRGGDYVLEPYYNGDHLNGISILDVLLLRNILLGTINNSSPVSPYQYLAANVSGNDCSITVLDLLDEIRLLAGVRDTFRTVNSHIFIDAKHQFPSLEEIRESIQTLSGEWCDAPQTITLNPLKGDTLDNDFVAVKMGDISLNALPPVPFAGGTVNVADQAFAEGDIIVISPEFGAERVVADVLWLYDSRKLRFVGDLPGSLEKGLDGTFINAEQRGKIKQVWTDVTELRTFYFEALEDGQLSESLSLDERSLVGEESGDFFLTEIVFKGGTVGQFGYRVTPNPVWSEFTLATSSLRELKAQLTITDATGRIITREQFNITAGEMKVTRSADAWKPGVYYLTLLTNEGQQTTRLIKQ